MTDFNLRRLLGSPDTDPGCEEAGELMDAYCELLARGAPVTDRYAEFVTHMKNCTACREDMDGLLAVVREQEQSDDR
jgi:hypothetical protein